MKIAVNTRFLLQGRLEGIGKFTCETLRRLTRLHPEHEFYFFFDRPYDPQFIFGENVKPVVLFPPARHPFLWYLWFEWSVAGELRKLKPDVFLSTDGFTTLSTNVPRVTVMHDLAFEHYPEDVGGLVRRYYRYFSPKFAAASARLVAVSEYTKQDIVQTYGQAPEKIDVVYNDASDFFSPTVPQQQAVVRQRFSNGQEYFMFVGAIHPRKNLVNLFRAFDLFRQREPGPVKLLIVGRKGWSSEEITRAYEKMKYRQDVVFTGRVSDQELKELYGSALATVYVPYFEGFGIPIVEAQKCGCPVITSNVTSMPEVAGESALLADPFSVEDIAGAMQQLHQNRSLRQQLVQKGLENVKRFSWEKSAEQLWQSLVKAVEKR